MGGAAGCTSGDPLATPTPSGQPILVPVDEDVALAHASFWAAWTTANRTSDPDEPTLAMYTIDPLLQTIQANLAAARDENRSYQGELLHDVLGMEIDEDSRRVHDCIGLGGWRLYELASGRPVPGQLTTQRSQLTILVFRLHDGQWRASNMYVGAECS